ncbi:MAG: hypothetical protein QOG10_962 [Kribbellaceae bacterium]|jgi:hypothetical protein|nr:hypothetical protein [Kribbellaceae bacterium]
MTKLTADEAVQLLRETFAEKENLVDRLPEAISRQGRWRAPALLAAASVLVIFGAVLYVGRSTGEPDPGVVQATVTNPVSTDPRPGQGVPLESAVWAAAIEAMAKWERPAKGWPSLTVLDAPHEGAGSPTGLPVRGTPFSADIRSRIEQALTDVAPIRWERERPAGTENVCAQPAAKSPYITVGPIVSKDGHVEVGINTWRGCLDARWLTYRLDRAGAGWKVTGTVGPEAVA